MGQPGDTGGGATPINLTDAPFREVFATDLLRRLRWKHLLTSRLDWLGIPREPVGAWLVELNRVGTAVPPLAVSKSQLGKLARWGLLTSEPPPRHTAGKLSLPFVTAVNLELTFDCTFRCSHCLQQHVRERLSGTWLPTDTASRAITEAWFAGILTLGINFTGGEIFAPGSSLPEVLKAAEALGLSFRVNTNGWWGNANDIKVGNTVYPTPRHVIEWLQEKGMLILALSFDERYKQYPHLWLAVLSLIRECERAGQDYQLVLTGEESGSIDEIWNRIARDAGVLPRHMAVVPTEMVDIGGASKDASTRLNPVDLACLPLNAPCAGLGFSRPSLLHIGPDGGVRTCMYAPGSKSLGNITQQSLLDVINQANANPVVRFFQQRNYGPFIQRYLVPFASLYRVPEHPCALSVLLARMAEEVEKARGSNGREPSLDAVRHIYRILARDFNLGSNHEALSHDAYRSSR